jgi:hypothetical protein
MTGSVRVVVMRGAGGLLRRTRHQGTWRARSEPALWRRLRFSRAISPMSMSRCAAARSRSSRWFMARPAAVALPLRSPRTSALPGESARMNAAFIKHRAVGVRHGGQLFPAAPCGWFDRVRTDADRALHPCAARAGSGLVAEVVPDDQLEAAAQPWVDDLLNASPMGLRMTKEGLSHGDRRAGSLEAAMAIENRNQLMTAKAPTSQA